MLEKYYGEKCLICSKQFEDNDDIVVCPDCGTPYHRACWQQETKCINEELHLSGQSWAPEAAETAEFSPRCARCGFENTAGTHFCGQCGMPLDGNADDAPRPFNTVPLPESSQDPQNGINGASGSNGQVPPAFTMFGAPMDGRTIKLTAQSDIDGVKLGDFLEYAGRTSFSMVANFIRFAATKGKMSFNIAAFFFPELYFFYRKMNKKGILLMLTSILLSIPSLLYYGQSGNMGMVLFKTSINLKSKEFLIVTNVCSLLSMLISIICGLFANYWYYSKARNEITEIRSDSEIDDNEAVTKIRNKGGTSIPGVIGAFVAEMLMSLMICLVLSLMF